MFNNMGRKIRILAQIVMWTGIFLSILGGVVVCLLAEDGVFIGIGIGIAAAGAVVSLICGYMLCGYGELIQSNGELVSLMKDVKTDLHLLRSLEETKSQVAAMADSISQNRQYPQNFVNPQVKTAPAVQQEPALEAKASPAVSGSVQQPIQKTSYYVENVISSQSARPRPVQMPKAQSSQPAPVNSQPINVGRVQRIENKVEEVVQ